MSLQQLKQALGFRDNYEAKVAGAADYVKSKLGDHKPVFGVVLGSGLGDLADSIEGATVIPYGEIPNFPTTTVSGHEGKMLIGELEGVLVIGLKGRKHYYEVADEPFNNGILQVVFPVHVLADLGVKNYFVTNASGGLNQNYSVGDIMILRSHINFLPNALLGRHHDFSRVDDTGQVWRFQPMNSAYDPELTAMLRQAGSAHEGHVHEGNVWKGAFAVVAGAIMVFFLSEPFVDSMIDLAKVIGVSPVTIAVVLGPIASEMPEKLTAYITVRRDATLAEISICNFIGSKVNHNSLLLGTLPIIAFVRGIGSVPAILTPSFILMTCLTVVATISLAFRKLRFWQGLLFLALYVVVIIEAFQRY